MSLWNTGIVQKALVFATDAHAGQLRKYTSEPYIVHPIAVATTVSLVRGATEEMVAAALLHDVVEDCDVSINEIDDSFGDLVAMYVYELTKQDYLHPEWNRARCKEYERRRLALTAPSTQTIKLADLMDNTLTIVPYDPQFAQLYLQEKRDLLIIMNRGDPLLHKLASDQIKTSELMLARLGYQLKAA